MPRNLVFVLKTGKVKCLERESQLSLPNTKIPEDYYGKHVILGFLMAKKV